MERATELIIHTLRLIFNNLRQALHITIPGFVALVLVFFAVFAVSGMMSGTRPGPMFVVAMLIAFPVLLMIFSAVAVAWHRYVLLDEEPSGLFPLKLDRNAWQYLLRSFAIGLLMLLVLIVPVMIMGAFAGNMANNLLSDGASRTDFIAISFPLLLLLIPAMYVFTRLAISLPAKALGREEFGLFDGWKASAQMSGSIWWLVIITGTISWLVDTILTLPFQSMTPPFAVDPPMIITIVSFAWQWFAFMFSICIITTLYGICVEGREI